MLLVEIVVFCVLLVWLILIRLVVLLLLLVSIRLMFFVVFCRLVGGINRLFDVELELFQELNCVEVFFIVVLLYLFRFRVNCFLFRVLLLFSVVVKFLIKMVFSVMLKLLLF